MFSMVLEEERQGDRMLCNALRFPCSEEKGGDRTIQSHSPSFEATTKGSWFQDLIFLLPFSSSGGEGVGG
jgi:hypothetical protein